MNFKSVVYTKEAKKQELLDRLLVAVARNAQVLSNNKNVSSNQANKYLAKVKWELSI